jgi:hypothetical protein
MTAARADDRRGERRDPDRTDTPVADTRFALAQRVADAVLYEGYILYPYRASAAKNQVRWQFGVVAPRGFSVREGTDPWSQQTECLIEPAGTPVLDLRLRFLQTQARTVEAPIDGRTDAFRPVARLEVDGRPLVTWEEGLERQVDCLDVQVRDLLTTEQVLAVACPGGRDVEPVHDAAGVLRGRVVREHWPISAVVRLSAASCQDLVRLRVRIENTAPWPDDAPASRPDALRVSLVGTHTVLAVRGASFVSLLDPPPSAKAAVSGCLNEHTWPVLIGPEDDRSVVLSSPIILYDHPAVAPESPGELCDSTEIDEILTLRIMTLTDEEKREARATDERARRIIERSDSLPPEVFERLHGAIRGLSDAAHPMPSDPFALDVPGDGRTDVDPGDGWVDVGPVRVARGARVRLRPRRRADAMDFFLAGRAATVAGVYRDVDGATYVAVTIDDDPGADVHAWYGRFYYFYPEEIEPLDPAAGMSRDSTNRRD